MSPESSEVSDKLDIEVVVPFVVIQPFFSLDIYGRYTPACKVQVLLKFRVQVQRVWTNIQEQ
jgi:hypothetical protein